LLGSLAPWPASGEVNLRIESADWKSTSKQVIDALLAQYNAAEANSYVLTIDGVSVFHPRSPKFKGVDDLFLIDAKNDPTGATYRTVAEGYTPDWWFSVRASNNEPLLRVNVEAQKAADVTGRSYGLISWIRSFCEKNGARVHVEDWGNLG
jgi:phosphomannomutase